MRSRRSSSSARSVRPWMIVGGLFLLLVLLGLLALPFRKAPDAAESAKADLEAAKDALSDKDYRLAEEHIERARLHTDEVQGAVQGIGGDVWSLIPVIGRPVADVRHMGNALDDLTSVAEIGVSTLPVVQGDDSTIFEGGSVDMEVLTSLASGVTKATDHIDSAQTELAEVHDSALAVGTRVADARDDAQEALAPLATIARQWEPMVSSLPSILGGEGDRSYMLALLNPSEQRFSGGAPLTIATLELKDGEISLGEVKDTTDHDLFRVLKWRKVKGDRFVRGRQRLSTATYAPDWPVAGEELLRAWAKLTGEELDGSIGMDVVALERLLKFTGPAEVPLYGRLDSTNFVQKLVGDYDSYPDNEARKDLNLSLVPLFTDRLMAPGKEREKLMSLYDSAQGRHFFMQMRDPEEHQALEDARLAGALSETDNDYLAVFNQNTNVGKADYWQRRTLDSEVKIQEDGSAQVRLTISVFNDSPPYTQPFADPRGGTYFTRWNGMTLLSMLPRGVDSVRAQVAGKMVEPSVLTYFDRPYARVRLLIPPRETREAVLEYVVPHAATIGDDGSLTYRLDMTPQGMVYPQAVTVKVQWPAGFEVGDLPPKWRSESAGTAVYATGGLDSQPAVSITGVKAD